MASTDLDEKYALYERIERLFGASASDIRSSLFKSSPST